MMRMELLEEAICLVRHRALCLNRELPSEFLMDVPDRDMESAVTVAAVHLVYIHELLKEKQNERRKV